MVQLPASVPFNFPDQIQAPRFSIGSRCRWIPQLSSDWGIVIGQVLLPTTATTHPQIDWQWVYLLMLDASSPSHRWTAIDWVSEDDLEPFPNQADTPQPAQQEEP